MSSSRNVWQTLKKNQVGLISDREVKTYCLKVVIKGDNSELLNARNHKVRCELNEKDDEHR